MKSKGALVLILLAILILRFPADGPAATINAQLPSMTPSQGTSFYSGSSLSSTVADDFVYQGVPISGITWWGAYWDDPAPQSGSPLEHSPDNPISFAIKFWSDTAPGLGSPPWGHPGLLIDTVSLDGSQVTESVYGAITRQEGTTQTVFQYEAALPEVFAQEAGQVYWLSIQALDSEGGSVYWGWQESEDHRQGNRVQQDLSGSGPSDWWYIAPGKDMAFSLDPMAVPLPASILLLSSGLVTAYVFKRHQRQSG